MEEVARTYLGGETFGKMHMIGRRGVLFRFVRGLDMGGVFSNLEHEGGGLPKSKEKSDWLRWTRYLGQYVALY